LVEQMQLLLFSSVLDTPAQPTTAF
jgi:hypothetical protein